MTRTPRIVLAVLLSSLLLALPDPAAGQTGGSGSSSLTGWSLDGTVIVGGSPSKGQTAQKYRCASVFQVIDHYNANDPNDNEDLAGLGPRAGGEWPHQITQWDLSETEVAALSAFDDLVTARGLGWSEIDFCGDVHLDGWLPANATVISYAEDPDQHRLISLTIDGEWECNNQQVVMVSATYWWSNFPEPGWHSGYGTSWEENYYGGLNVTGEFSFQCLTIFDGPDPANFSSEIIPAQVQLNPDARGLTGLETWMWYEFPTSDTFRIDQEVITINVYGREWILSAHAWLSEIHWDIDCETNCTYRGPLSSFDLSGYEYELDFPDTPLSPAPSYDGGSGTEGGAAVEHLYETLGDYQVSTATLWQGYWTFEDQLNLYPPVVVAEGRPYQVIEVRPVIINSGY